MFHFLLRIRLPITDLRNLRFKSSRFKSLWASSSIACCTKTNTASEGSVNISYSTYSSTQTARSDGKHASKYSLPSRACSFRSFSCSKHILLILCSSVTYLLCFVLSIMSFVPSQLSRKDVIDLSKSISSYFRILH